MNQNKYQDEYKKYIDVFIEPGIMKLKSNTSIQYEVLEYSIDRAVIKNVRSGFVQEKTGHWARKNLIK